MNHPVRPSSVNGSDASPDSLERLGQRAADLATAAGDHTRLLLGEARFRITQTLRESMLSLALNAAAVLASVVGYTLLIREVAHWLAVSIGMNSPEPVTVIIYVIATVLPLMLLKLRAWWHTHSDLSAHERRHRTP